MRRTIAFCLVTAAALVGAGAYSGWQYGYRAGRDTENDVWRRMVTAWGCGGWTFDTGEWVIVEGGTCRPFYLDAVEPEGE